MATHERVQGCQANYTGTVLQEFVNKRLCDLGYKYVHEAKFKAATYLEQPIYTWQHHIGDGIYGLPLKCDFTLYHPTKWPDCLIIECKWQQSGGSVDEKYPYLVLNIQHCYPYKTLLLLDGGGYRKGAAAWLRKQVGNNLLHVWSMAEFTAWANRGHL